MREFLPFTPEIREILLDVPPERLIWKTEELLNEYGQTMQQAAQRAYDEGKIGREWLPVDFMAEQQIVLPESSLEKMVLRFLDFIRLGKAA